MKSPGLAISRSIGDFDATKFGVISEPDFCIKTFKKEMDFITITSDGIWEFLENEDVCNIIKKYYLKESAKEATEELIKKCREIWEKGREVDDITVITIFF